jgi:hypothetical protein
MNSYNNELQETFTYSLLCAASLSGLLKIAHPMANNEADRSDCNKDLYNSNKKAVDLQHTSAKYVKNLTVTTPVFQLTVNNIASLISCSSE